MELDKEKGNQAKMDLCKKGLLLKRSKKVKSLTEGTCTKRTRADPTVPRE